MSDQNEGVGNYFVRQRRNLLGVTIVLIAFNIAGIEFTKVNILGNSADITNPQIIINILWMLTIYFYVRYLYCLKMVGGISEGRSEYNGKFNKLVKVKALQSLVMNEAPMEYVDINEYPRDRIKSAEFTEGNVNTYKEYPVIDMNMDVNVKLTMFDNIHYLRIKEQEKVQFKYSQLRLEQIRAFLYVVFSTRVPTEYYLPLIFPICAAVYILR